MCHVSQENVYVPRARMYDSCGVCVRDLHTRPVAYTYMVCEGKQLMLLCGLVGAHAWKETGFCGSAVFL